MENYILYFAYGSNLNKEQMKKRCPNSAPLGKATLSGYALKERTYADIEPATSEDIVYGALWKISKEDLLNLDNYEGYPSFYDKCDVTITYEGKEYEAIVYFMTSESRKDLSSGYYLPEYIAICSQGCKDFDIPDSFKKSL